MIKLFTAVMLWVLPTSIGTWRIDGFPQASKESIEIKAGIFNTDLVAPPAPTFPAPIAWWKLDDNASSTTVADSSGNGYTGTAYANTDTKTTTGVLNGALRFDKSSDYVEQFSAVGSTFSGDSSYSFWIAPSSGQGVEQYVFWTYSQGYASYSGVRIMWDGTLSFLYTSPSPSVNQFETHTLSPIFSTGQNGWKFITITLTENDKVRLYCDGVEEALAATDNHFGSMGSFSADVLYLGARVYDGSAYYGGTLDDVRIYNVALSSNQVSTLYNSYTPPPAPALVTITFDVQSFGSADFYENEYTIGQYFSDTPYMPTFYPLEGFTWDGSWTDGNANYYSSSSQVPASSVTLYPSYY
jgi:hypothetical protein